MEAVLLVVETDEAAAYFHHKEFVITILRERLDYLRIVASRGYAVDSHELEVLKAEIVEEEAKLERLLRGEA